MADKLHIGDLAKLTGTFTDPDNSDAAIDPTAVFVAFTTPTGVTTTYTYGTDAELTKASTGVYNANVDCTAAGRWLYRWYSTGTAQASEPGSFWVYTNDCG